MSPSDHNASAPGSSEAPSASYSILKFIVIFLGILLVLGFAVVVGTIVYRLANSEVQETAGTAVTNGQSTEIMQILKDIEVSLPSGSEISGHDLDGSRLSLQLRGPDGAEVWIIDLTSGEILSRIKLQVR